MHSTFSANSLYTPPASARSLPGPPRRWRGWYVPPATKTRWCAGRDGCSFPAHHRAPLVCTSWAGPPGLHPLGIHGAEQGFAGGADGQPLLQFLSAALGDPGHLGGKALHTCSASLSSRLSRISMGKYTFLWPVALKRSVHLLLNQLPNAVAVGLDDHAAPHPARSHTGRPAGSRRYTIGRNPRCGGNVLPQTLFLVLAHGQPLLQYAVGDKRLRPAQGRSYASVPHHLAALCARFAKPLPRGPAGGISRSWGAGPTGRRRATFSPWAALSWALFPGGFPVVALEYASIIGIPGKKGK